MSNLLDRASVVLTPTAYNNGEALCIKPDDGSGDFQFSRNSAATRVNAQGLVENVQILSSNLVQNGDFSEEGAEEVSNGSFSQEGSELITNGSFDTDSDWQKGTGWSIANGKASNDGTGGILRQANAVPLNTRFKVVFTISDYVTGDIQIKLAPKIKNVTITGDGTYIVYTDGNNSLNTALQIIGINSFQGSIDNVSVKEVGQDWTLETGWSIGEDKAISDGSGSIPNTDLVQSNVFTTGKSYKVTLEIKDYVSGNLQLQNNTTNFPQSNGIHTIYSSTGGTSLILRSLSFNGSITNISVKEVGQNWIVGSDWSIAENKAVSSGSGNNLQQTINILSNKTYKLTFDVISTSGTLAFDLGGATAKTLTDSGSKEYYFQSVNTNNLRFYGGNYYGSVTNISVIEITDDTNLPRINYEGFSYQDALGSELVVNGGFDSDTAWNKNGTVTISGGTANFNNSASGNNVEQAVTLPSGKQYIATYEITSITEGKFSIYVGGVLSGNQNNQVGVYTEVFTSIGNNVVYVRARGTTTGSIDNVSVKEYLGQEVVPDSGCGSWLFEPQSTNLVLTSDSGTYGSTPPSETNTISPDGTNNAIIPTPTANANRYQEGLAGGVYSSGQKITYSWYRKRISTPVIDTEVGDLIIQVLTNLTIFESTTQIQSNINGYDRFQVVVQVTDGSLSSTFRAYFGTVIGVGNSSVAYWGHQFEVGGYATSLIPTEGSTVTRNQDVCTNGGSLASINSTEGVLYAEIAALADGGSYRIISLSDGTDSNRIIFFYDVSINRLSYQVRVGNASQFNGAINNVSVLQFNKVALKYKENDFALWINGVEVAADAVGNIFPLNTLTKLSFSSGNASSNFFGKTKALAVWKEALSDEELTELTTI